MEISEALAIVRSLESGLDPDTHVPLARNAVCCRPRVVIAFHLAVTAMEGLGKKPPRKRAAPANGGKYWSRREDANVCDELRRGLSLSDIATAHSRSVPSIVARLIRLGKIGMSAAHVSAA
jgi:hypothetical protein